MFDLHDDQFYMQAVHNHKFSLDRQIQFLRPTTMASQRWDHGLISLPKDSKSQESNS